MNGLNTILIVLVGALVGSFMGVAGATLWMHAKTPRLLGLDEDKWPKTKFYCWLTIATGIIYLIAMNIYIFTT